MVELRKRKSQASASVTVPTAAKKSKPAPKPNVADTKNQTSAQTVPQVNDILDLEGFGGEIETNDGTKTSLKKLVEDSTSGVVLFTYPKASTPGCTKQPILPRPTQLSKRNRNSPTPCSATLKPHLSGAIGLKKSPKGTTRGVFVVDKKGKVLLREAGGPDATVDAVQKLVAQGFAEEDTQDADSSQAK
ncbi:uncharacterized protein N7477_008058 [Penicillium maclennaniae]|uniref:uncharacterized protein n=1 Tax=Penicillium maclennaniae TaxID=1343394 RepID=UPI002542110F|nr:uncharacterized protein N7477_008058 [Penicillium maclennaniae]KAJ5665610.1 hypothetical protein N7477_008058 [Penicillium maclennaniae]